MNYVNILANIGKYFPGKKVFFKHFTTSELTEAIEYLYQDKIKPLHVLGGVVVIGVASISVITVLLSNFLAIMSALVLSITIGLLICLILLSSILSKYQNQLIEIEKATPQVLEELATLYITTGSVFESIEFVSKGDYGTISSEFSEMIGPMNHGTPPEYLLRQYAASQPSMTLRRGLLTFIQFIEASTSNLEAVITDSHENLQRRYERRTLQRESRMMVLAGLLVFLPIIFILGVAIRGLASHPLVLLLPIIQLLASKIMISILLPKDLILLGE